MCGVIVVDAESFRSTFHGRDAYIHDHCLRYRHNFALSVNCSAVICSPTIIFSILREASSETYGPQVYLLFSNLYHKNTKNVYLIILSLSDLTFASGREGIDNPLLCWSRGSCLFV